MTFKAVAQLVGKSCSPSGTFVFRKDPALCAKWKLAESAKTEGNALYSAKKLDEAIAKYREACTLHPTNKIYYSNKVLALLSKAKESPEDKRGDIFNEALKDCRTMRQLDVFETYQKGHHVRGVVFTEMKHYTMARTAFQTVLNIDPNNKAAKA